MKSKQLLKVDNFLFGAYEIAKGLQPIIILGMGIVILVNVGLNEVWDGLLALVLYIFFAVASLGYFFRLFKVRDMVEG